MLLSFTLLYIFFLEGMRHLVLPLLALICVTVLNYLERCISDIDECAMGNGGCEALCFNKPGSFSCGCEPGHLLMPDQRSCQGNLRVGYLNCVNVI